MSAVIEEIKRKAAAAGKRIVLAEGEEQRIIDAASEVVKEGLAELILLGDEKVIRAKGNVPASVEIINPETSPERQKYADMLYELRKSKGLTPEAAFGLVANPLYLGALLIKAGKADGMVAGSITATSDVLRPALQIIKTAPGINTVSSFFLIALPEGSPYGKNGVMIYADCGVVIEPDAEQLADIAIASAGSARAIAGLEPKVAMLSFSTKGSAKHPAADKVIKATELAKAKAPDLMIDGELQADAALVESVGQLKSPGSPVAGKANVLIFPDLSSGNIAYKLTQRLGNAIALGPICQGFNKPVNDLSRGCTVEDVVNVVAITVLQATL